MPQLTLQQAIDLAVEHYRAGRKPEAERIYQQVLRYQPEHVNALHQYSVLLVEAGRIDEAVELMRRAVRAMPTAADCWLNLGIVLFDNERYEEAADAFTSLTELAPTRQAFGNLGTALRRTGRFEQAISAYHKMMALRAERIRDGWSIAPPEERRAVDDLLILLHQDPASDAKVIFENHVEWNRLYAAPLAGAFPRHPNDPDPHRRIRVGYVSGFLGNLPIGRFMSGLLANHDHGQFEVFCYSDTSNYDAVSDRLRDCCDHWRHVSTLDDEELAYMVRNDGIDIFIDLSLHAALNRMQAFARKPAPVQMTYLNYCSTTGLPTIDYRFSDACFDPEDSLQPFYSEQTVRLQSYWCYPAPPEAPPVLPRAGTALITFGCLNEANKLNPTTFSIWTDILQNVADSRLLLHAPTEPDRQLARAGLKQVADRVEFVGKMSIPDYFKQYHEIDIALDPMPWCGGTTTCDALWMGVPVVTLAGRTTVSRGGRSILTQLGLTDLIAYDRDQYLAIAARLAADRNRLSELRSTLRDRMLRSPLMDALRFARDFESILRKVWQQWCATRAVAS